jgi:flagellar biosynthesis/type III secretory pathway M-ring protein FliF/YscJ
VQEPPEPPPSAHTTPTLGYPPSYPTVGHDVPGSDWFVIWGPLGVGWLVSLLAIAVLWRAFLKQRDRHEVATAKADEIHRAELAKRDEAAEIARQKTEETFRQIAREQHEATRQIADKYHDHAVSLRAVVESARNRIGRRE